MQSYMVQKKLPNDITKYVHLYLFFPTNKSKTFVLNKNLNKMTEKHRFLRH